MTVASYRCIVLRVRSGTQADPSSRSLPATVLPSEPRMVTVVTLPPASVTPISALTGTPVLPRSGVSESEIGVIGTVGTGRVAPGWADAPGVVLVPLSPQPTSANGTSAANATIVTSRLLAMC